MSEGTAAPAAELAPVPPAAAGAPPPMDITPADVVSFALALVFGVWFYLKEHWAANNMLGMGLAVTGIEYINLGSFQIGCILLVSLPCWLLQFGVTNLFDTCH